MLSPHETGYDSSGSLMRAGRAASRRELLKNKRARNTDILPGINEEDTHGKTPRLQISSLREENLRLRQEIEELQEQLTTYQSSMDLLDGEIETIHRDHRQEIEQYQQHLREMMEERNQMQEANQQWEHRYQDLYHSFQDEVEIEANKMVKEAAQTLILSPEHPPALLNDVVKTFEDQVKQTEDRKTAELMALIRQAQYKSELLEQEFAHERDELAQERNSLQVLRENINRQAQQRYQIERNRLRARWTAGLTFISLIMLSLLVTLEIIFYSFKWAMPAVLFTPLVICMLLTYALANLHTSGRLHIQVKGQSARAGGAKAGGAKAAPPKKDKAGK